MPVSMRFPGRVFLPVDAVKHTLDAFVIFDVRYSLTGATYGIDEYRKGHIPNAFFADMNGELCGPLANTTARHPLPPAAEFGRWCQQRGVDGKCPVLCYDGVCGGMAACRMWWMLTSLGVEAYVLDGGFPAYAAAGLPTTSDPTPVPHPEADGSLPHVDYCGVITIDELQPHVVLTDARPYSRYSTTVRPYNVDALPGHIPGAISLPWDSSVVEPNGYKVLRPEDELRASISALLADAGAPLGANGLADASKCVFSCGSGVTACFNVALATHLGLGRPLLYCGSWSEYAGRFHTDIARRVVEEYGFLIQLKSNAIPGAPAADPAVNTVTVDGTPFNELEEGTAAVVRRALPHLHPGESAAVCVGGVRVLFVVVG